MVQTLHTPENENGVSPEGLVVRAMFDAACAGDEARFRELWADNAVWDNVPVGAVRGRDQIVKYWKPFLKRPGSFRAEIKHLASFNGVVHTERVDLLEFRGLKMKAPVSGVFEVRDGKIVANREYWDLASITAGALFKPLVNLLRRSR